MPTFTAGALGVDFDQIDVGTLAMGQVSQLGSTSFIVSNGGEQDQFSGSGFVFGGGGLPTGGVITGLNETLFGQQAFQLTGLNLVVSDLNSWVASDSSEAAKIAIFAGADEIDGSDATDLLRGYGGDDTINGNGGNDQINGGDGNNIIHGGTGDDVIAVTGGTNYLRGDDGDDHILGGAGFDDINGNKGNDTIDGGAGGNDWLVGGQGDDLIIAEHSSNLVYGNLGNDTLQAGDGGDTLRGGQGDDSIQGGAGADFISGDRGNDTESGGPGADIFHGSQDAGIDRVLDFNQGEGDRVQLDPGTTYTLTQVGSDTVIDMGAGNQMILVGVQLSTLKTGWIFEA
ncbi:calcium-binding protein [Phenylobacterium sp.]|jgi:Ca2+-binding RTX toxin-like protein|uniref:calcium-binding protein n=1 Tax=Phenylobacterium sp. TaxID=1871053 RepID=UPI002E369D2F|nr:calcium-binding protein [Phenylobacterium sp.]HEX3366868.1 calcium-binding protein [Phenylobacterium sp.]